MNINSQTQAWKAGCEMEINNETKTTKVTTKDGTVFVFGILLNGLMGMYIDPDEETVLAASVAEVWYPKRSIDLLSKVPIMRARLNYPSNDELVKIMNAGRIKNLPITSEDLELGVVELSHDLSGGRAAEK